MFPHLQFSSESSKLSRSGQFTRSAGMALDAVWCGWGFTLGSNRGLGHFPQSSRMYSESENPSPRFIPLTWKLLNSSYTETLTFWVGGGGGPSIAGRGISPSLDKVSQSDYDCCFSLNHTHIFGCAVFPCVQGRVCVMGRNRGRVPRTLLTEN